MYWKQWRIKEKHWNEIIRTVHWVHLITFILMDKIVLIVLTLSRMCRRHIPDSLACNRTWLRCPNCVSIKSWLAFKLSQTCPRPVTDTTKTSIICIFVLTYHLGLCRHPRLSGLRDASFMLQVLKKVFHVKLLGTIKTLSYRSHFCQKLSYFVEHCVVICTLSFVVVQKYSSCKSPVEIGPCTSKTMNTHIVDSHFQVKGKSWHFAKKTKHIQICSLWVPHYLTIVTYW